jgi:hypothetical protein
VNLVPPCRAKDMQNNPWAVLSPYLIPPPLAGKKICNLGDGFILRAIERHLGCRFASDRVFSPRVEPSARAQKQMSTAHGVVLAGANQLNDKYTVWPGLNMTAAVDAGYRFIPFGIGLHGEPGFNDSMSSATRAIIELIHERIPFSSWRCSLTVDYLRQSLPHLADRFLMTGCPVIYDTPLLEGERFDSSEATVAVTATERGEFWDRENDIIHMAARRFPKARKFFVVHQNFSPGRWHEPLRHRFGRITASAIPDQVERLRFVARQLGFRVVVPKSADACLDFYAGVDVHVGTRLHAHLLFLSRNKRSYLVPVDGRATGIAQALGFPLPMPADLEKHWDFDFETVRHNTREHYKTMKKFIESLTQ